MLPSPLACFPCLCSDATIHSGSNHILQCFVGWIYVPWPDFHTGIFCMCFCFGQFLPCTALVYTLISACISVPLFFAAASSFFACFVPQFFSVSFETMFTPIFFWKPALSHLFPSAYCFCQFSFFFPLPPTSSPPFNDWTIIIVKPLPFSPPRRWMVSFFS